MDYSSEPENGKQFDAAFFAQAPDGDVGLVWEDPRELHHVEVAFAGRPPEHLQLQYWRTKWPQQRLPKDGTVGGGATGWWELGNWFTGEWQTADTEISVAGNRAIFTFRPASDREFPDLADFDARFRTTLKVRIIGETGMPNVEHIAALTDSTWEELTLTVLWETPPDREPSFETFNGRITSVKRIAADRCNIRLWHTRNTDPNTFDKTLLTIRAADTVTVLLDDLSRGPIWVPHCGLCVIGGEDERQLSEIRSEAAGDAQPGVYDRVSELPEQTWSRAWGNMVPKKSGLYLPLGADGGRHRFALNPDGSIRYRTNNRYLLGCPGDDTERLAADKERIVVSFGLTDDPVERGIQCGVLPIGVTRWDVGGVHIEQTAFATVLEGTDADGPPPAGDAFGVCMAQFSFRNTTQQTIEAHLPVRFSASEEPEAVRADDDGCVWAESRLRAYLDTCGRGALVTRDDQVEYVVELGAGVGHAVILKVPYVWLTSEEMRQLKALDFDTERKAVAGYWRRVLGEGMELTTPEPVLNDFHRAVAGHMLINCELEPDSRRRFARCGSFGYGLFANEGCMMVVDLDRRGYHEEAEQCLEALLYYQGSVALPGDFSSQEGVLYGAHGYEAVGYNQHHGWTLWCLVEHYRFTRDDEWLRRIAPNIVAAADWIIRERSRTQSHEGVGGGLLPHGALEDIGDWWQWLSTNVYSWRGLDAAAWGLEQVGHPDAQRVRQDADDYRQAILRSCTVAARRSPVVKLRNGAYVPHFPSHPHRRGRSFGWICETLEGAIHLLISGILSARSPEAEWILNDYEDNLYNAGGYGYIIGDYEKHWFDRGGFSMQACLLFGMEPYLCRDDVKHALRAAFNAMAANLFPDTRMLTEHALPELGDWKGDHYKSSDEANACGWLRYMYVREQGDCLLLGQAIPRDWLKPGNRIGVGNACTHFGPMSLWYEADEKQITAYVEGPRRNPPAVTRIRFRVPAGQVISGFSVDGAPWDDIEGDWVILPGDIGQAEVTANLASETPVTS